MESEKEKMIKEDIQAKVIDKFELPVKLFKALYD